MQAHIRFHVKDRIVYGFTRRNTRFHQFKVHIVFITVITFSYLHEVFSKRNSRNNAFSWSIVNNKNINLVSCDPDAVFQQIDLLFDQKIQWLQWLWNLLRQRCIFYFFAVLEVSFETMVSAMSFMVLAACSEGRTSIGGTWTKIEFPFISRRPL